MPGPVFLRDQEVSLRVVEEEDLPFLQRVINDPEVWVSLQRVSPATMEDERAFYEETLHKDDQTHLLICADDKAVGIVGLSRIDPEWGVAELGYFVDPAESGNGYGTSAVNLMVTYAFDHRRLRKLIAHIMANNPASRRVVEKNGFVEEGRLRDHVYVNGDTMDLLVFGLRESERGDD